jgi:hypothetical protein
MIDEYVGVLGRLISQVIATCLVLFFCFDSL